VGKPGKRTAFGGAKAQRNLRLFGTQDLSDTMLVALEDRRACLLGTHGMICFHDNLDKALWLAIEVEALAKQYWYASQAGEPTLLSDEQMAAVMEKFKSYGKQLGIKD
jgi:L-fuculose-phosphate aldolase